MTRKEPRTGDSTGGSMDSREIAIFKALDPKVQERWRIQAQLKNALLGYAILDLVECADSLVFGTWNPRLLQPQQVQQLVGSFHDGLDRFDLKTVIPIVIPKATVDETSLTRDPSDPSKLSELKLRLRSTPPENQIKCASGRHRVAALKGYLADIKVLVDQHIAEWERIAATAEEDLTDVDVYRYNNILPGQIKTLGGIQKYGGQWMVAVYDEGLVLKDGLVLAQHLSRNETKHVYMETDEERVIMEIQYMATLDQEKRAARLVELRSSTGIRKKANKLVAILNSNTAFHAIEQLVQRGAHFMEMPEMNMHWLHAHLCGTYGGLLCAAVGVMAARLDMCFSSCDLSHDAVDNLLTRRTTEDVDSVFQSTYNALCNAKRTDAASNLRELLQSIDLLQIIDDAWAKHMPKQVLNAFACMDEEGYVYAYQEYVQSACDNIMAHVEEVQEKVPVHLQPLLHGFAAKFKFVCLNHTSPFHGLPVLTQAPLRALANHLGRIQEALKEVSRWLEPLVDYMVTLRKSGTAPSYTQAAIDALRNHDHLKRDAPVQDLLLQCILQGYGACLDLEVQLGSISHTDRITSTKELAPLFAETSPATTSLPVPIPTTDTPAAPTKSTPQLRHRKQPATSSQENDMAIQAELARLRTHATQLVKAMQSSVKSKDPIPLSSSMHHQVDGVHLVLRTSWGWRSISANSRLREFQNVAGTAVLEWGIIEEYRPQLLKEDSGAHYLRSQLVWLFRPWLKPIYFASKWKKVEFSFADQLPHTPVTEGRSFIISDVLPVWQRSLTLKADATVVQSLVKAVERCPLAWDDPDNEDNIKFPPLQPEVEKALKGLVEALESNAFRWHTCGDVDERSLHVVFRGTGNMTRILKGENKAKVLPQRARRQVEDRSEMHGRPQSDRGGAADTANPGSEHIKGASEHVDTDEPHQVSTVTKDNPPENTRSKRKRQNIDDSLSGGGDNSTGEFSPVKLFELRSDKSVMLMRCDSKETTE
ncbi:hypothetical protein EDC04DRAFT_237837 [Pisolithus marmoratus]|nr:hypothetical protein EDC04DRAFT_237837 [Pisolithus marmoratus]